MKKIALVFFSITLSLHCSFAQTKPIELPWNPRAIAIDSKDNLYIEFERMLMKITPDGVSSYVSENIASGFRGAVSPDCEIMVADSEDNIYMTKPYMNSIWKLTPEGKFTIHAAEERYSNAWAEPAKKPIELGQIEFMAIDNKNNIYFSASLNGEERINQLATSSFHKLTPEGELITFNDKNGDKIKLNQVDGIGVDSVGNLYVSNVKERCIKKITAEGEVVVVAGQCGKRDFCPVYSQGDVSKAELVQPGPIVFNKKGELFFADHRMNRIIKVANNKVTTIAGASQIQPCGSNMGGRSREGYKDGNALDALFDFPSRVRIAIDSKDNIYILDGGNYAIRKLTPSGIVSTIAKTKK
ncbi:hypothetical protein ACFSQD_08660 [Flavihumibacter stibioxidans]|nr:hypothetical protein [Flavihumibacter stibioxidans]